MPKQIIICKECGNEISTEKSEGFVQCGKVKRNGKKCGVRTEI